MNKDSKIYVAGHRGLVGSAIEKALSERGYENIVMRTHSELDLTNQQETHDFFRKEKPEYVFLAAATVGGIMANSSRRAEFIYNNMMIAANVIHSAYESGVTKLLNLGSSCIYPKMAPQPMKEKHLLTGLLEETNEPYAIAKISAIKLCMAFNHQYGTNFISAMPTNLYGPNDNFDLASSHVLPAMIRKFHEAKLNGGTVELWGDGSPMREFLYSVDLADGLLFLMDNVDVRDMPEGFVNIGTGQDLSIRELAEKISNVVGFEGEVVWDASKPNGTPRKLMDVSCTANLGWTASTSLDDGLHSTYEWYIDSEPR